MARLVGFGADNGTRDLDALDSIDLEAIALVRAWSVNGYKESRWRFTSARTAEAPLSTALATPAYSALGHTARSLVPARRNGSGWRGPRLGSGAL